MSKLAIPLPMDEIRTFCRKWKVARLEVFGSILRDDFRPDSDVDFLVTWEPDARWSLFDHMEMEEELAAVVGREVDLVSRKAVEESRNWIRREDTLRHVEVIHAA